MKTIEPCKINVIRCNEETIRHLVAICGVNGKHWNVSLQEWPPYIFVTDKGIRPIVNRQRFSNSPLPKITPVAFIKKYGTVVPSDTKPQLASRKNDGKIPLSFIFDFPIAMLEFCRVCMNGAKKYNRDNWKKGRPYRDTIDSLLRHIEAFQNGGGYYMETLPSGEKVKFHHMANAMWNCAVLLEWSLSGRKDLDDRYKKDE